MQYTSSREAVMKRQTRNCSERTRLLGAKQCRCSASEMMVLRTPHRWNQAVNEGKGAAEAEEKQTSSFFQAYLTTA